MARIDNLFDVGQGKLGNLVFYKMNGKGIVRSKPEHYSDRKSPAQLAQRQRLQVVNAFLSPFRDLIRITFASEAESRTARAAATSFNMRNALAGEYPDKYVDKSKALLSRGPLPLPLNVSMEAQPDGLHIRWENGQEATGISARDNLVLIALSELDRQSDYKFTEAQRSEGKYVWKTTLKPSDGALPAVWIAFRNRQETQMSDSLFVEG